MANSQRVLGKVDRRPLQPDHLASSEPVVSGKENGNMLFIGDEPALCFLFFHIHDNNASGFI